jgi:hypothetical protein
MKYYVLKAMFLTFFFCVGGCATTCRHRGEGFSPPCRIEGEISYSHNTSEYGSGRVCLKVTK